MKNKWMIWDKIKELNDKGFFQIFGATIINSMVSFVYGIFIVRLLSQNEYGLFSYTQSIANFGILFSGMGLNLGMLQFCSENRELKQKYSFSKFSFQAGFFVTLLIVLILLLYARFDRSNMEGVALGIVAFSFLPMVYWLKDWIIMNLRWQLKNREYAFVMNVHSVLNAFLVVVGAYIHGLYTAILGIYLAYIISIVIGKKFLKGESAAIKSAGYIEANILQRFVKYSFTMCIVNAMISVLFTIDIFVIGNVLQNAKEVALYRTASVIPFALNMIPNAIMTFMYPYISKNKNDKSWLKSTLKKVYIGNGLLNIFIGICLFIIAEPLVHIVFGNAYRGSVHIFRLLTISYIINSSLRTPSANILGMLQMTKSAFVISAFTVLLNAFLSFNLVNMFGIVGAAYSSCITFTVVGITSFSAIIKYVLKKV